MRHVNVLSRMSCYTLTDSLFHRLREAQLLDDCTKVLKSVVETKGYEDFYIVNEVLFKDPNKEFLHSWKPRLSKTVTVTVIQENSGFD